MTEVFELSGSFNSEPAVGDPAGSVLPSSNFNEKFYLKTKEVAQYTLTDDNPKTIALGGLTQVHVIMLRASGGKVRVRLTSADGSTQSIPVDPTLHLISLSVPITAIDVTRVTGISTIVNVFIGEKS